MNLSAKITTGFSALAVVGLVALTAPAIAPLLPQQVQVALGGTIHTVPGTVDELFAKTESGDARVTHCRRGRRVRDRRVHLAVEPPARLGVPEEPRRR